MYIIIIKEDFVFLRYVRESMVMASTMNWQSDEHHASKLERATQDVSVYVLFSCGYSVSSHRNKKRETCMQAD